MGDNEGEEHRPTKKCPMRHNEVGQIPLGGRDDFNLTGDLEMLRRRERKAVGLR